MFLTKANLIDSVYNELDFQKQKSTSAVESLLEIVKHTLASGEDVVNPLLSANSRNSLHILHRNKHPHR